MDIDTLFSQLHSLPSIPQVALELVQQFDNRNESLENVARNIERDPVIAAKVLRLANSARFKGARESASIEDAAMRLGFNVLRTLVLASAVTGAFKSAPGFDLKVFWGRRPEVGAELGKRWNLPLTIQSAIRHQAQPHLAPEGQPYARIMAQAMEICDALEQHGGPSAEARNTLGGPLFDGVDLDALFDKLPQVLEQDKAFADFLA